MTAMPPEPISSRMRQLPIRSIKAGTPAVGGLPAQQAVEKRRRREAETIDHDEMELIRRRAGSGRTPAATREAYLRYVDRSREEVRPETAGGGGRSRRRFSTACQVRVGRRQPTPGCQARS